MAKLIFVNLPVSDLARATAFYEAIGAVKNAQFSDDTASNMGFPWGGHAPARGSRGGRKGYGCTCSVVLTNREHIIALDPLDKGLMGTLLRYPYEVRSEKEYFDDIQDVKVTKDMLDLAKH